MGREGAFANVGLRSRSGSNAFGTASPTAEQGGCTPIDRNAVGAWSSAAYVASLSAALNASRSVLCAGPPRGRLVLRSGSAISDAAWILEVSNICPATKKALHLCKALIFLVFLAPRPGLEPGTYGLTVRPPHRALGRANAGFALFGCLIFPPSFARVRPGSGQFGGRISDSSDGLGVVRIRVDLTGQGAQSKRAFLDSESCRADPWIYHCDAAFLEVIDVASCEPGAVMPGDSRDLRIKLRDRPPCSAARADNIDVGRYGGTVECQDTAAEVFVECRTQSRFQSGAPLACWKQPCAKHHLGLRDGADEQGLGGLLREPSQHRRLGRSAKKLRHHVGVEQRAHRRRLAAALGSRLWLGRATSGSFRAGDARTGSRASIGS